MNEKEICSSFEDSMILFIEGKLEEEKIEGYKNHLSTCDSCSHSFISFLESENIHELSPESQRILEYFKETMYLMKTEDELEPEANSWAELQKRIKKQPNSVNSDFRFTQLVKGPIFSYAAMAACFLLVAYSYFFYLPWQTPLIENPDGGTFRINNVYFDGNMSFRSDEQSYTLKPNELNILHIKPYDRNTEKVPYEIREINSNGDFSGHVVWNDFLHKNPTYGYLEAVVPAKVIGKLKADRVYKLHYIEKPDSSPEFLLKLADLI